MSNLGALEKLIWPWPETPVRLYGIWLSLLQPAPSPRYQPSPAAAGVAKAMSDAPASAMVLSFISEYPRFEITMCHRQRMTTLQWLLDRNARTATSLVRCTACQSVEENLGAAQTSPAKETMPVQSYAP